jgi:alpha-1,2-mannosyltransferase
MQRAAPDDPPRGRSGELRTGDWLTAERTRIYGWMLVGATAVMLAAWIALSSSGLDPKGRPLGADFTSFWSAARLTLSGAPASAYNQGAQHAEGTSIFGRDTGFPAFFYPPIFLLVCAPLGLLPYLAALATWLVATGVAYWRALRAWLGSRYGVMPIFAFPAVLLNVINGQNGFLSAALFGAGAISLDARPILAGVCLGALAYKPQLGLIVPVALALSGRWKTFAAAAATVVALTAVSLGLFGVAAWQGFFAESGIARAVLERRLVGDAKIQSAFAAVRLWGGPLWLAYGAQALAALAAVAGLVWLQRRAPRSGAEGPAMVTAALLCSPYLLDYDLILLAIPLAWLLRQGARTGFLDWEKSVMAAAFILPLFSRTLATLVRTPIAPLVVGALFVVLLRRGALRLESPGLRPT